MSDFFQSKQTLHADTVIMGVPVWTVAFATFSYILWNSYEKEKTKEDFKKAKEDILQLKNENAKLSERVQELERDYKEYLISELIKAR